jgi:regulator of replication initiation timing
MTKHETPDPLVKKLFFLLLLLASLAGFGQKVSIEYAIDQVGDGYNSTCRVKIPHASEKILDRRWTNFLKDNKGKVRTSKGQTRGENVRINGLGHDSLQFYSRYMEDADGMLLKVAVMRGGAFLSFKDNNSFNRQLENILLDFALTVSKEGLDRKVEEAEAMLASSKKEQNGLVKTNERLSLENENMKKRISENEATISSNAAKSEELTLKIQTQQGVVEQLRAKFSELK